MATGAIAAPTSGVEPGRSRVQLRRLRLGRDQRLGLGAFGCRPPCQVAAQPAQGFFKSFEVHGSSPPCASRSASRIRNVRRALTRSCSTAPTDSPIASAISALDRSPSAVSRMAARCRAGNARMSRATAFSVAAGHQLLVGRRFRVGGVLDRVQPEEAPGLLLALPVDGAVDRHPGEIGGKGRAARLPAAGVAPQAPEGLLDDVVGLRRAAAEAQRQRLQPAAVAAHDLGEGTLIAGGDLGHQRLIGRAGIRFQRASPPGGLDLTGRSRFASRLLRRGHRGERHEPFHRSPSARPECARFPTAADRSRVPGREPAGAPGTRPARSRRHGWCRGRRSSAGRPAGPGSGAAVSGAAVEGHAAHAAADRDGRPCRPWPQPPRPSRSCQRCRAPIAGARRGRRAGRTSRRSGRAARPPSACRRCWCRATRRSRSTETANSSLSTAPSWLVSSRLNMMLARTGGCCVAAGGGLPAGPVPSPPAAKAGTVIAVEAASAAVAMIKVLADISIFLLRASPIRRPSPPTRAAAGRPTSANINYRSSARLAGVVALEGELARADQRRPPGAGDGQRDGLARAGRHRQRRVRLDRAGDQRAAPVERDRIVLSFERQVAGG